MAKGEGESRTGSEAGRVRVRDTKGGLGSNAGGGSVRLRSRSSTQIWVSRFAHSFRLTGLSLDVALRGQRPGVWQNSDESGEGTQKRPYRP